MVTPEEILRTIVLPALLAAILVGIGRWRGWGWLLPLAAGCGLPAAMIAYTRGAPGFPPINGSDWIFWAAMPVTICGVIDALTRRRLGWLFGLSGVIVAFLVMMPLVPSGVSRSEFHLSILALAAAGAALCAIVQFAQPRLGAFATIACLCLIAGGAGVLVMSTNMKDMGLYGAAVGAALGPVALATIRARTPGFGRGVAVVAIGLLMGVLTANHAYADPSLSWPRIALVLATPVIMLAAAVAAGRTPLPANAATSSTSSDAVPGAVSRPPHAHSRRPWLPGVVAIALTAAAIGAIVIPAALAAKEAAGE